MSILMRVDSTSGNSSRWRMENFDESIDSILVAWKWGCYLVAIGRNNKNESEFDFIYVTTVSMPNSLVMPQIEYRQNYQIT